MNKKALFIGGALVLAFMAMGGKANASTGGSSQQCPTGEKIYMVDGNPVCESVLPSLNYIYWNIAPDGSGWYNVSSFYNNFNYPIAQWHGVLYDAGQVTLNPVDPNFNTAQNLLNNNYKGGATPLQQA